MQPVYLLKDDTGAVQSMQAASQDATSTAGFKPTHGLIGTETWWENIRTGALKVHRASGSISGFWPGQWSGGPAEFEIHKENGNKSVWLCNLEPQEARNQFVLGRAVSVDYVWQQLKTPFNGKNELKLCIAIHLGELARGLA